MGWVANLLQRFGWAKAARSYPRWLTSATDLDRWDIPSGQEWEDQVDLYETLSWVNIAVSQIAGEVAVAHLKVLRIGSEEKPIEIYNHPLERLLRRPNPRDSRYDLLFATAAYRELTGNAYWHLNRRTPEAPPAEIWPIPSHRIKPIPDKRMFIRHYEYDPGLGQKINIPAWQILHFRRFHPRSMYVGLSPIQALMVVAAGDKGMQKWNANFFARDHAKPSGILAFKDVMSKGRWDEIKRQVQLDYGGTARKLMMLQGVGAGVNWIATQMSQRDLDFLLSRKFTKEEIFGVYAPGLANILDVNATEANAATGMRMFKNHVYTQMVALAEVITNNLLPIYGEDLYAEFDDVRITDAALDLQRETQYLRTHTIDETRRTFYNDEPLGDNRGQLMVAEVSAQRTLASTFRGTEGKEPYLPGDEEDEHGGGTKAEGELAQWRRYANKRSGRKAARFVTYHLRDDLAEVIRNRLRGAASPEEVKAAFVGPF